MTASDLFLRLALGTGLRGAMALALLIGAGQPATARARGLATADPDKAIAMAEAAIAKTPHDPALRGALGHAYIHAGRFEAAAAVLSDAAALGDNTAGTTLSLALAQIACGRNRAALATLDRGAATIAPAELGLALALAGDAERGIAVLTDGGQDAAAATRLRQNLAYADALAGRWADARLTASYDLPPEQVEARLQQWAQVMQSGGERIRIARLLNVPVIADPGLPAALALNDPAAGASPLPEPLAAKTDAAGELLAVTPSPADSAAAASAKQFAFRP